MKLVNIILLIYLPQSSAGASELGGGVLPTQLHRTPQVAINTARKTNKLRWEIEAAERPAPKQEIYKAVRVNDG